MFAIWGFGTKKKMWEIGSVTVTVMWEYYHFMFLPAAAKRYWYIKENGNTENTAITIEELTKRFPSQDFKISIWQLHGLRIVVGVIALVVVWRIWFA